MIDDEKERHWDREMADVDRLLKKLPTYEPAAATPRGGEATVKRPVSGRAPAAGGSGAAAWVRAGLGLALAVGMTVWPYRHVCGIKLFVYLGGLLTLVVAGGWAALAAWQHRRGLAHLLSLAVVLWGLVLTAATVLPRVGYTGVDALWFCPEPPVAAPAPR